MPGALWLLTLRAGAKGRSSGWTALTPMPLHSSEACRSSQMLALVASSAWQGLHPGSVLRQDARRPLQRPVDRLHGRLEGRRRSLPSNGTARSQSFAASTSSLGDDDRFLHASTTSPKSLGTCVCAQTTCVLECGAAEPVYHSKRTASVHCGNTRCAGSPSLPLCLCLCLYVSLPLSLSPLPLSLPSLCLCLSLYR